MNPTEYISDSGIANTPVEQTNGYFSEHQSLPYSEHQTSRLIKAKRFGKWHILKTISTDYTNHSLYIELMNKEFDILFQLEHPNIVRAFNKEHDKVAGHCIVMEYIDGITLTEFIKTHQGNKKLIRKIGLEIIDAMIYFHGKQIVHRDLKPDNILITHNGHNVKIIDFGLSDTDYHSVLKQPAGTLRYCAPEQKDKDAKVDGRSDIYAFGMILIESFTGKAKKDLISKLPYPYRQIARKCIQNNRDERYATAIELRDAFTKKSPVKFIAASGLFILAITAFSIIYLNTHNENQITQNTTKEPITEQDTDINKQASSIELKQEDDKEEVIEQPVLPLTKKSNKVQAITNQTTEEIKSDNRIDNKESSTLTDTSPTGTKTDDAKKAYKFRQDSISKEWYRKQRVSRLNAEKIYYPIDLLLGKEPTLSKENSYDPNGWHAKKGEALYRKALPVYEKAVKKLDQAKTFSKQVDVITKYVEEIFKIETGLREEADSEKISTLQRATHKLFRHFSDLLLKDSGIKLQFANKSAYLVLSETQYKESQLYKEVTEEETSKFCIKGKQRNFIHQKGLIYTIPQDWYILIL